MNQNDLVKVKVDDKWRVGTVLSKDRNHPLYLVGIGEKTHFNYKEEWFGLPDIKRFQEITPEEANALHLMGLEQGLSLAQEALAELLPSETVDLLNDRHSDPSIRGYHGAVTLDPVVFEQETIGAFIERAGYQVTVWNYHHATRQQPEEYVDAPVGTFPNIGAAVQSFVQTIFKLKASDYWQHKADEAQAAAWEEDNAGGEAYIGGHR
jgi:hypothetical protein